VVCAVNIWKKDYIHFQLSSNKPKQQYTKPNLNSAFTQRSVHKVFSQDLQKENKLQTVF
jgi:hypothetical protein